MLLSLMNNSPEAVPATSIRWREFFVGDNG